MLNQATLEKMHDMKMHAMAEAFDQQLGSSQYAELSFEERTGMLIDTEWTSRQQRKLVRRLKSARLRYQACLEDVDFKTPRGLDKQVVLSLGTCRWIQECHNLLVRAAHAHSLRGAVFVSDVRLCESREYGGVDILPGCWYHAGGRLGGG